MTPEKPPAPSDPESLLEALVTGSRSEDDPEVRALFARDASARGKYEALKAVSRAIDSALREERDVRGDAQSGDAGGDLVERTLRKLASEKKHSAGAPRAAPAPAASIPASRRWIWIVLLAAAIGLFATWIALRPHEETPDRGGIQLGTPLELLHPIGTAGAKPADYAPFRWRPMPGADAYEIIVFDAATHAEVARKSRVRAAEWTPAAEQLGALPRRIEWTVAAQDAAGAPLRTSARGAASLR